MWQRWNTWYNRIWLDRPLSPGTILGTYRILSVLGSGSYGIAYTAEHLGNKETVVLKQVKPSLRGKPKGEEMQRYEQKVLESLAHPQIPAYIESFRDGRNSFLVMSYVHGQTLEDLLFDERRVFTEREAVSLVKQVALIVRYLHQQGIIHRDVRIPNVIWRENQPYLLDYGLARYLEDQPTYISDALDAYPDEKQIKRRVEPASDLYALGHFLLFLLYSGYDADNSQSGKSWEEELALSPAVHHMVRKFLQLDLTYADVDACLADIEAYLYNSKSSITTG